MKSAQMKQLLKKKKNDLQCLKKATIIATSVQKRTVGKNIHPSFHTRYILCSVADQLCKGIAPKQTMHQDPRSLSLQQVHRDYTQMLQKIWSC